MWLTVVIWTSILIAAEDRRGCTVTHGDLISVSSARSVCRRTPSPILWVLLDWLLIVIGHVTVIRIDLSLREDCRVCIGSRSIRRGERGHLWQARRQRLVLRWSVVIDHASSCTTLWSVGLLFGSYPQVLAIDNVTVLLHVRRLLDIKR